MARKASRPAKRRAPGRPPRRLADEVRRHQLAREIAPDLIANLDDFLSYYPAIVERRRADRVAALLGLSVDLAAWAALAAPGEEAGLVERLFAAGTVTLDPHVFSWHALAESGSGDAVLAYVKGLPAKVADAADDPPLDTDVEVAVAAVPRLVEELADRLRGDRATHGDAREVAGSAALAAAALVAGRLDDEEYVPPAVMSAALVYLLNERISAGSPDWREAVGDLFEVVHAEMPAMLDHVRAHLDGEIDDEHEPGHHHEHGHHHEEGDDELSDGEEDEEPPPLGEQLVLLDRTLASVDEAGPGADAARALSSLLLATSLPSIIDGVAAPIVQVRLLAALGAFGPEALTELARAMDPFPKRELYDHLTQAAQLARAELPPVPRRIVPVDGALKGLEAIVRELQAATDEWVELDESAIGGLGLLGAAADSLRIAAALDGGDADTLAALQCLDPLALADRPEQREIAAARLEELAAAVADLPD